MKRLLFLPALAPALGMGVLAQTYSHPPKVSDKARR